MSRNILIVEDEKIVSQDLENTVKNWGHNVIKVASNSQVALSIPDINSVDIALVDLRIDNSNDYGGLVLASELNKKYGIKIIFVTADFESKIKCDHEYKYISKPFNMTKLKKFIEES